MFKKLQKDWYNMYTFYLSIYNNNKNKLRLFIFKRFLNRVDRLRYTFLFATVRIIKSFSPFTKPGETNHKNLALSKLNGH